MDAEVLVEVVDKVMVEVEDAAMEVKDLHLVEVAGVEMGVVALDSVMAEAALDLVAVGEDHEGQMVAYNNKYSMSSHLPMSQNRLCHLQHFLDNTNLQNNDIPAHYTYENTNYMWYNCSHYTKYD